mgnify:FL=1
MKKIISFVFIVAAMMFATSANAQIKFGLKGGLDVTNMSLSSDVFDASNKTGFFIGPMVKVTVPIVGLSFDAAALYDQREAKVNFVDEDETFGNSIKQKSIIVPVNVRYGFGLSSLANAFIFAGPQWNYNVGDKNFYWKEEDSSNIGKYSLKKSAVSANVGVGVTLLSHLQISANYNFALSKSAEIYDSETGQYFGKSKNNSWQIALGYWF